MRSPIDGSPALQSTCTTSNLCRRTILIGTPKICLRLPISAMCRAASTSASIATASPTSADGSTKEGKNDTQPENASHIIGAELFVDGGFAQLWLTRFENHNLLLKGRMECR